MKNKNLIGIREIFCIFLSALLLFLATPPFSFFYFAYFSLFFALLTLKTSKKAFLTGFIYGFFYNLMSMYWITYVLSRYGNLPLIIALLLFLLLASYLSLYPAIFFLVFKKYSERIHILLVPLVFSLFWIFLEFIRSKILTGFPWMLIGYTQYGFLEMIQLSSLGGVYLISFLVIFFNLSFYVLFTKKSLSYIHIIISSILFVFIIFYGRSEIETVKNNFFHKRPLKVLLVQGNIDQSQKWEKPLQRKIILKHIEMTKKNLEKDTGLVVWSETALPVVFGADAEITEYFKNIIKEIEMPIITGFVGFKWDHSGKPGLTNSAGIFYKGELVDKYDKVHLVPFGEYVPLQKILFFVNKLVATAGDFLSGDSIKNCNYKNMSFGIMICYESIFPEIAKTLRFNGADVFINITNDAWFGNSPAPYQHFVMSIFRAVENRKYLIRVANTGISGIVTPWGEVNGRTKLFEDAVVRGVIYY